MRLLLRFIDRDLLPKLILVMLLFSIVPLAEIFLFLYLGDLMGNYLVLILAAVAGLAGVPVALGQLQGLLPRLREKLRDGRAPVKDLADLAEIIVAGAFLITPGFITDVLGYLLLVPAVRAAFSRFLARKMRRGFRELHDFLGLDRVDGLPTA